MRGIEFRTEVRRWLEANLPASMRTPMSEAELPWGGRHARYSNPDAQVWLNRMIAQRWVAPTWPKAYGGGELSAGEASILHDELARLNARPALFSFGLWMLGPVMLEYATEEQRARFLPPIAFGQIRWCQGYSEPGAGSDLASLRTRAVDRGDHWLVDGQKIWTSYADQSDWIFCLVRTDTLVPKHRGISFLLIDLASPGVSTRPIALISGNSPFCETFFDSVRVPKGNLIGELNGGWAIAKKLLQYERQNVSAAGFGGDRSVRIESLAKQSVGATAEGKIADPVLRSQIARQAMYEHAVELTVKRSQIETDDGKVGTASSVVKYASAKANQDRHELAVEALGLDGLGWSGDGFTPQQQIETKKWLRSKGNSIEGGTSEINLNVIAKRVLELPDYP